MCMYFTLQTHIISHHCHYLMTVCELCRETGLIWPVCCMFTCTCISLIVMIQNTVYNPCWQTHVQWNLANLNPEIRTPPHSGHLVWSQFCMLANPWNQDTSIKLTPEMVPWVSGLERFLCTFTYTCMNVPCDIVFCLYEIHVQIYMYFHVLLLRGQQKALPHP